MSPFAASLLAWYDGAKRSLPWRDEPTPYRVLLSELMLQQTRVATVLPYFRRFVDRWPTLESLAAAPLDEVLSAWSGLGYYSRAKNLHRAARAAVAQGGLAGDAASLMELPGIGPYTAGAIASIAFGRPELAVDGNVERVACRCFGIEADPRGRPGRSTLRDALRSVMPVDRPGDFNQALMELGATVCLPGNPRCAACPIAEPCVARATGRWRALPNLRKKEPPRPIFGATGLLEDAHGRTLLGRRPERGLLAGLFEPFTLVISEDGATETEPGDAMRFEPPLRAALDASGVRVGPLREVGRVVHVFTHRRLTCRVYSGRASGEPGRASQYAALVWSVDPRELPLSKLARKLLSVG